MDVVETGRGAALPPGGAAPAPARAVRGDSDGTDRVVFLLGGARSGTTWLAKILDSHPDVLYRHEPDIALGDYSFPTLCEAADIPRHRATARAYLERLLDVRTLKTSGSLPTFRKSYLGPLAPAARTGLAVALRALECVPPARAAARAFPIPDLVDWRRRPELRLVLKSVSALGRAGLYAAAMPAARFVLILRHPCGQVGSMLRGQALSKFEGPLGLGGSTEAGTAARYGLTPERFAALSPPEQHAWDWGVLNDWALEQLRASGVALKVVRYEDVCADPRRGAEDLLDFAGLPWDAQTERFVADSTSYGGPDRFYQVFKNTRESVDRWRRELSPEVQRAIMEAARHTESGRMFVGAGAPP